MKLLYSVEDDYLLFEDDSSVHGETSQTTEATENCQLAIVPASNNVVEVVVSQSSEMKSEVNDDGDPDSKRQYVKSPNIHVFVFI